MEIQATEVEGFLFQGFKGLACRHFVTFHGWGIRSQGLYLHMKTQTPTSTDIDQYPEWD
jgi:hypothetical protein